MIKSHAFLLDHKLGYESIYKSVWEKDREGDRRKRERERSGGRERERKSQRERVDRSRQFSLSHAIIINWKIERDKDRKREEKR